MENRHIGEDFLLICVIVNMGQGSSVAATAREEGVPGATIVLGRGTVKDHLLQLFGITDRRKEIVLMLAESSVAQRALRRLQDVFQLDQPHRGIAFTIPVSQLFGVHGYEGFRRASKGGEAAMYNVIFAIVDQGKSEAVIDSATQAGAKGGTIIHGRGSGFHTARKIFGMEIEPEKEIVMIVSESTLTEAIVGSIREDLDIDAPGKGILFVQDIKDVYGIR
ncbi:MAG: P-II family nitrogen regulator [Limnochordia bacterium]|jgi:nitrogen regulatory protein PII